MIETETETRTQGATQTVTIPHTSPWNGRPCVRPDCDGVGHVTVASSMAPPTRLG